jgi:hypothetical protein
LNLLNYLKKILLINKMQQEQMQQEQMQQEQMQQEQLNNTTKKIYFKWARTINTLYLPIDSCWTLNEFIEYVKNKVGDQNIELVQTMQGTDTIASEDAEAVESSNEITIYQKFGYDWTHNYLAFYIRKISSSPLSSPISSPLSSSPISCCGGGISGGGLAAVASVIETVRECVICFNSFPVTNSTPYGCQHFACPVCVKECMRTNNNRCSICRLE